MSETWDEVAALYGSGASPFARFPARLVARAAVGAGERVLDVGCGNGLGLAALADGGVSAVVGIDFSGPMLKTARVVGGAALAQADAAALPLADASFDVVLASSVIQFVGDAVAALREWRRVLHPGGRLLLSVPAPADGADPTAALVTELFRRLDPAAQQRLRAAPGARTVAELAAACAEVGLVAVTIVDEDFDFTLPDREAWWSLQWTHGFRRFLRELDPTLVEVARDRAFELVGPQLDAEGRYVGHQRFHLLEARNP